MSVKDSPFTIISTGTMIRFFLVIFGLVAVYIVRDILVSLFFAVIVASALEPAILWLQERRIPRILGTVFIYVAIAAVFLFAIYLVFPVIFDELKSASQIYGVIQQKVLGGIDQIVAIPLPEIVGENIDDLLNIPARYIGQLGSGIFGFASTVFGGLFSAILVVVFSFYLAAQEKGIENFLRLVTPLSYELYVVDLWDRAQKKLGRWLRAQMLLGAIVGILIFFGLTLLGVREALFLAVIAALFEIIPIVGPILAAIPAVAIAFLGNPVLGLFTLALYIVVQQAESHVIVPVVMRKAVGLSPLIVVLALLIGVKLGGIFGILLAVPVASIVVELVNDWDKKKRTLLSE